jgi:magnesium-transporting ATPase (P-type)
LHSDGRNELRETKRIQPWRIFARQFSGLLVAILFGASLIPQSLAIGSIAWLSSPSFSSTRSLVFTRN